MPDLNDDNVRHLLRRTEFVDRDRRVNELISLGSIAAAVDNILDAPATPPSMMFRPGDDYWTRGAHYSHFWLDQMATDSPRPMQEKMALFWHGHFVSSLGKVHEPELMREQIDLFRVAGLSNVRTIAQRMSLQVAMLRYLDNNENKASSPNQNFARELLELFLLEVGNYTEADVEAAAAAWTGHGERLGTFEYEWRPDSHDSSSKQFLGQTINSVTAPMDHGAETIDVVLGSGVIPAGADNVHNRGRAARDVAAEFLSRKLWTDFAGTEPPSAVLASMRDALVASNFEVKPWARTMLTSDEFFADDVKVGLVRSPVEWIVAMLYATGLRSEGVTAIWKMPTLGQALLRPPDVSGWKVNGYFINASAMDTRAQVAANFLWHVRSTFWEPGGFVRLRGGEITQTELLDPNVSGAQIVDRILALMELRFSAPTRQILIDHLDGGPLWKRTDVALLILLAPEFHTA